MKHRVTLALAALLLLGGCAALEEELARRQPEVRIDSASVGTLSFDGAELIADVRIDNPNPVAVDLAGFDYDLQLAGNSLLKGRRKQALRIGADKEARIEVPLQFGFADVRDIVRDIGSRDEIDYALKLGLDIDIPVLGTRTIPARTSGALPVPRLPSIAVEQLRVDELGWNGAQATLELAITNPNTFGLALNRLHYDLAVNGAAWVSGKEGMTADVPAKGTGRVSIPVRLDFATIGRGAYQLLTGSGGLDYTLDGNLEGVAGDNSLGAFDFDFSRSGKAGIQR